MGMTRQCNYTLGWSEGWRGEKGEGGGKREGGGKEGGRGEGVRKVGGR